MTRHLLAAASFCLLAASACAQLGEHIIVSGGPALRKWEDFRPADQQHDRWWGNFIAPASNRIKDLRFRQPGMPITWLVYRDAYYRRTSEDGKPYVAWIQEKQTKFGVKIVWFGSGRDVIAYINSGQNRGRVKITGFEYYGHSNKHCFMFDYSSDIYGVSSAWLHEEDLGRIHGSAFARNAYCQSWGCHTAESMSDAWAKATGTVLIGAYGKTDYSDMHLRGWKVGLSPGAHWRR